MRRFKVHTCILLSFILTMPVAILLANQLSAYGAQSGTVTFAQIEGFWISSGGTTATVAANNGHSYPADEIAAAIVGAESSDLPANIQQGESYTYTGWGLWQITSGNEVPQFGIDFQLLDPWNNAEAAVSLYNSRGFEPWTTYEDGAWTNFLPDGSTPAIGDPDPGQFMQISGQYAPSGTHNSSSPGTTTGPVEPGDIVIPNPDGSGYWLMSPLGAVYAYGGAPYYGGAYKQSYFSGQIAVGFAPANFGTGYWILSSTGAIFAYGTAQNQGGANGQSYFAGQRAVSLAVDGAGTGYWITAASGAVFSYNAPYYGHPTAAQFSGQTAVGLFPTPGGAGYWIVSNTGAVYPYGSAPNEGQASGQGYFSGQTAVSFGVSSLTGYWIVSQSGAIFTYGSAPYDGGGNTGDLSGEGAVSMAGDTSGTGYWIMANTGNIYAFGSAPNDGGGFG